MSEGEKAERIADLMTEIPETLGILESNLPQQVDGYAISQKSKLPWKVLLYREALIWRIVELGRSALESFLNDRLISGIVLTRAAVETSAALWYLSAKVDTVVDSKAVGDVDEYLMKLAMGTATTVAAISDAVCWAEEIMRTIDERWPSKKDMAWLAGQPVANQRRGRLR